MTSYTFKKDLFTMHCNFKPGLAPVSSSLWCEASVVRAISVLAPSAIKVSFKLKQLHKIKGFRSVMV